MEEQSSPESSKSRERSSVSDGQSTAEFQERKAGDRLRDEASLSSPIAGSEPRGTLSSNNDINSQLIERVNGQPVTLAFDNSIYGDASGASAARSFGQSGTEASSLRTGYESTKSSDTPLPFVSPIEGPLPGNAPTVDSHGNITQVDDQGNISITSFDGRSFTYIAADGRGYIRTLTDNGFVENRFGPNPRDNYDVRREYNGNGGAYTDHYSFSDSSRNHRRDVSPDGRVVVTDAAGLRIHMHSGSAEFQERVLNHILDLPLADRQHLARVMGVHVIVAERVRDVSSHPPSAATGWDGLYEHRGGIFHRPIIISEYSGNAIRPHGREGYLTRHEFGHAIDHSFGALLQHDSLSTERAEFLAALREDRERLDAREWRDYLGTFGGTSGPAELFADLYAAMTNPNPNDWDRHLLRHFPSVVALLRRRLQQIRGQ